MCRTAVRKVSVLRRSVFWGLAAVGQRFLDVLWEFEKPKSGEREEGMSINVNVGFGEKREGERQRGKTKRPEEEFLSSLLLDDVQLVVVPQSTGHFLIRHIVPVLGKKKKETTRHWGRFFSHKMKQTDLGAYLVVSPETCQSIGVNHPEHQAALVFPSDVFLVTVVTQQLIHVVPQQSALWRWLEQEDTCCQNCHHQLSGVQQGWEDKRYIMVDGDKNTQQSFQTCWIPNPVTTSEGCICRNKS